VNSQPNEPWVIWCDLNDESKKLVDAIDGAVEITGSDTIENKEARLSDFAAGRISRLVSKPSICGWGLNWQHCARQAFVGVTDSWEAYYQAVRRSWRFGQKRDVHVHIFASVAEGSIVNNLKRKERDAIAMSEALSSETAESVKSEVIGSNRQSNPYNPQNRINIPLFL
jgi:SNF2 family DNA or RNA helicase